MTNKISQSTTQFPLLRALAGAARGELPADAAVDAALKELGGDPADKVHRTAVGNGKWELKKRGCAADAARGVWAITELGRKALADGVLPPKDRDKYLAAPVTRGGAAAEKSAPAPAPRERPAQEMKRAEEPAAPVETAPVAESAPVAEPAPAKRRLKVANAPAPSNVEVPAWLDDADIRALAIESTECFGAWSARSNECGRCPLAGWCRNAKASTLALLATKLTTETPATPEPVKASVAKLDEAVGAANAPDAPRTSPPENLGGLSMKARHEGVCAVSGRPIREGDSIRYTPGVGLYHANETPPESAK